MRCRCRYLFIFFRAKKKVKWCLHFSSFNQIFATKCTVIWMFSTNIFIVLNKFCFIFQDLILGSDTVRVIWAYHTEDPVNGRLVYHGHQQRGVRYNHFTLNTLFFPKTNALLTIKWVSEYRTCLVFEWSKVVWSPNSLVFKCHLSTSLPFEYQTSEN